MTEEILCLVKFGSRENMEDFRRNGTMYMNTVAYFRTLEGMGDIGDVHEALEACYQSDRISINITPQNGQSILLTAKNGLTGQVLARVNASDAQNIFCMYAIRYCGKKPVIDPRNFENGRDTYVCITNGSMFLERVRTAAKTARLRISGELVKYVPKDDHHGSMGVFKKFATHQHQSEYRFVVSPGVSEPYRLILGDISDITIIGTSKDINDHVELVELPPQETHQGDAQQTNEADGFDTHLFVPFDERRVSHG